MPPAPLHVLARGDVRLIAGLDRLSQMPVLGLDDVVGARRCRSWALMTSSALAPWSSRPQGPPRSRQVMVFTVSSFPPSQARRL
ncbi:hypothetical protein ASG06_07555 [Rathayibacter sp. Leaf185]|nr:hypothetical protein ASF42_07555 [Rathayibacter sp. Leaf294]KQS11831.1 hypothetical protein ASG06_07555 [Rathayibacter sp. Leaf185]